MAMTHTTITIPTTTKAITRPINTIQIATITITTTIQITETTHTQRETTTATTTIKPKN
jgi:hypothetical protein